MLSGAVEIQYAHNIDALWTSRATSTRRLTTCLGPDATTRPVEGLARHRFRRKAVLREADARERRVLVVRPFFRSVALC
jgi:hypothetical protein